MFKRTPLKFKLLSIALLPLLFVLILSYGFLRNQMNNLNRASDLRQDLSMADEMMHFLLEVEDERLQAIQYSIKSDSKHSEEFQKSYLRTDESLEKTLSASKGHMDFHDYSYLKEKLQLLRVDVIDQSPTKTINIGLYDVFIDGLIDEISFILLDVSNIEAEVGVGNLIDVLRVEDKIKAQEVFILKYFSPEYFSQMAVERILSDFEFIQQHVYVLQNSENANLTRYIDNELRISDFNAYESLIKGLTLSKSDNHSNTFIKDYQLLSKHQKNAFHSIAEFQVVELGRLFEQQYQKSYRSLIFLALGMFLMILMLIWILYLIYKDITGNINNIKQAFGQLAIGDTNAQINIVSEDEFGDLGRSFEGLRSITGKLAQSASHIGKGDYDSPIEVRGENDLLGNALVGMRNDLKQLATEREKRNWQLTGQAKFSEIAQQYQHCSDFSDAVLSELAGYCDIQQAAFYVKDLEGDVTIMKLVSTYAFDVRKGFHTKFLSGEGIIGQAWVEKKRFVLTDVPDNYSTINSGLGNTLPVNILVLPLISEKEVKGIIELAALHTFQSWELEFLDKLAESLAGAISLIEARKNTELLLQQTQEANERLRTQEEELRVTNEELAEQAQVIKQSEEELRVQQEELLQSNVQLEEKSQLLEENNQAIQVKNSELENAREAITLKAKELEQASRYKSEFLANMSHELRTPLNSMLILANLLSENKPKTLNNEQIEYARVINKSGNDLLNLINDILDLSKIESRKIDLDIERFKLDDLSSDLMALFESLGKEKNIEFTINRLPGTPEIITTDRFRLEQIIRNLLSNSFKFTPKGGRVFLEIFSMPSDSVFVSDKLRHSTKTIGFAVKDNGIGIPEEKRKLIFEAFKQADGNTNRKYGGTGLGLSISRELAIMLGGEIRLESILNMGSTFTLILPQVFDGEMEFSGIPSYKTTDQPIIVESADVIPMPVLKDDECLNSFSFTDDRAHLEPTDRCLLIIEDDEVFAHILASFAREKSFKVIVADRGDTGLSMALKFKPHAIILDIGLPVMDGWTVIKKLKQHPDTQNIPVHIITGNDNKAMGLELGAVEFVKKPVSDKKLQQVFSSLCDQTDKLFKKVLIIEDNKGQQDALQALFGQNGIQPLKAFTGAEALELLSTNDVDVIILDLSLPDVSGMDLLKNIKTNPKYISIPLIIYTGKELSREDNALLLQYSNTVVSKKARSNERLLDEVSLFIRKVNQPLQNEMPNVSSRVIDYGEELKGKKVLLADDDMRNIFALEKVMESVEMKVVVANDGKDALDKLEQNPDIDIVLMDIMMPVMDGYEAIRKIRAHKKFRNIPVIALTAKAMKGDRDKCIDAGASDYLAKPVDTQKLLSLMRVWLSK
jgi:CheY-like chemotaxis protein/GAF domain-containing protein